MASSFVRSALRRFAAWSALVFLVLVAASILIGSKIARESALQEARLRGGTIAHTVAAPLVDQNVRSGHPVAMRRLDSVMRARFADGDLIRVKLWSREGKVLWSDQGSLVGKTFPLETDVEGLFGTREVIAELSDLSKAENVEERRQGELLEVYAGTRDAGGEAMVFEAYLSTERMRSDQRRIVLDILPLTIGGLLLFLITVLPLAAVLARRVHDGEAERVRILRHALLTTAQERRKIAADLHDGVIQDLAGLSYAMPEILAHLPDTPEASRARDAAARTTEILFKDVSALRSLLANLYPPDLRGPGFASAVEDLAMAARITGVEVEVLVPADYDETLDANRLAYRVVQEALRNVVKHAHASRATVSVERRRGEVHVAVRDDGVGVNAVHGPANGHMGLVLLEDTLKDFRGSLVVRPLAQGGTLLEATFPADLLDVLPN